MFDIRSTVLNDGLQTLLPFVDTRCNNLPHTLKCQSLFYLCLSLTSNMTSYTDNLIVRIFNKSIVTVIKSWAATVLSENRAVVPRQGELLRIKIRQ